MNARTHQVREPLRSTVIRNALIALGGGAVLAATTAHSAHPFRFPVAVILICWPSFGGHWLEIWYLDWLQPRLPAVPSVQRLARLGTWFIGGCGLGFAMVLTTRALGATAPARWHAWWLAGLVFTGLELVVHTMLQLRGKGNFFNGRG